MDATPKRPIAAARSRPAALVIGFAAETGDVVAKAEPKRRAKGCDWLVANDVAPGTGTFGGDDNTVHLITADGTEDWPRMTKRAVAERLAERIAAALAAAPGAASTSRPPPSPPTPTIRRCSGSSLSPGARVSGRSMQARRSIPAAPAVA